VFVVENVKCICRMGVTGGDVSDVLYIFFLEMSSLTYIREVISMTL